MSGGRFWKLIVPVVAVLVMIDSSPAEARRISIQANHARCVADNLSRYLNAPRDPVIVMPSVCPNLPTARDLGSHATAQSGVHVMINENSVLMVLRKNELRCIAALYRRLERAGRIPPVLRINGSQCPAR